MLGLPLSPYGLKWGLAWQEGCQWVVKGQGLTLGVLSVNLALGLSMGWACHCLYPLLANAGLGAFLFWTLRSN